MPYANPKSPETLAKIRRDFKKWYASHRKENIQQVRERKRINMEWLWSIKRTLKCIKCGESDPVCIDFHHRIPKDKYRNVVDMVHYGCSREKILEEVRKCDPLCANCHRKEHRKEYIEKLV